MQTNQRKKANVLWIDRWSKYIGVAYTQPDQDVIFPIGYLLNDAMLYFSIGDIIQRYHIKTIVLWMPKRQKDIQEKIQQFIQKLNFLIESNEIDIETVEEDYTSVQSWEILSNFKKNVGEDTVSAMLILERRKKKETEE